MSSAESPSLSNSDPKDYVKELREVITELSEQPGREEVASELEVLQSIYGDESIRIWHPSIKEGKYHNPGQESRTIRYEAELKVLISIPPTYPASSPPQLQLLSRYIGAFGADSTLFGSVLKTFISVNGVEWVADTVCVFDGLQSVLERCNSWYEERLSAEKAGEMVREDAKESTKQRPDIVQMAEHHDHSPPPESTSLIALPEGLQLFTTEPITDRKSTFVGRACRISHPSEVPLILSHLMTDRRIARAAHPIINAWRCQIGTMLHQDNDDNGESAAGGRLAHLLQILEVNNVLVIVTRYFGGIHLGSDRFKHINQAARNALELGGFLDTTETKRNPRGKRH